MLLQSTWKLMGIVHEKCYLITLHYLSPLSLRFTFHDLHVTACEFIVGRVINSAQRVDVV